MPREPTMTSHLRRLAVAFLVAVAASGTLYAQAMPSVDNLIARLQSQSVAERTRASQDIFGAGINSKALYAEVAKRIGEVLPTVTKDSPKVDELAWHAKAIGTSGDMAYMPLLEQLSRSDIRGIARHAKGAQETLREAAEAGTAYLDYTKVMVLTEKQAEGCRYVAQRSCETSRSADKCVDSHKDNAVEAGANAIMLLMTSSQSGALFSVFGSDTTMLANYYACPIADASSPQSQ
ncbi:hypothetical protein N800_10230 [Lysobacter daejeonensis GH1-9]|uniref:Uncharacterized protein n=2 Tax=Aerolutibacter TaxID=3382701 RepID=A0A0A0EZM5_9GAMM|nr:hypothetical protein N800_10230 [Lysobacter daejeonensis GH1-9]